MSEISQFHKLARLAKRMDKEVSISSDAIVALSEEIAELEALADYFRDRCYHWIQITKKWRRECKDAEALAADRLEMNKELVAAAQKVLRTSLGRKELLRRGIKPMNSAEYKIWVEDVAEELGDE